MKLVTSKGISAKGNFIKIFLIPYTSKEGGLWGRGLRRSMPYEGSTLIRTVCTELSGKVCEVSVKSGMIRGEGYKGDFSTRSWC